jgi:hypothetical protein
MSIGISLIILSNAERIAHPQLARAGIATTRASPPQTSAMATRW